MAKVKISDYSTTAGNNTDINSINIAEGCAPSGINDAIRELMRQLKEFQTGGAGDSVNSGGDFSVATNKFTVASASGNTAVAGTLAVTGTTTLTGALVANGNATLGDASGDTVTIKGTPTLEVNPTLSGGTANGVLYLNGSKVATSGSALTFDGSQLEVNSLGTQLKLTRTGVGSGTFNIGGSGELAYASALHIFYDATKATEYMRLTSSSLYTASGINVGIGTSSPAQKLNVVGNVLIEPSAAFGYAEIKNQTSTAGSILRFTNGSTTSYFGKENSTGTYTWSSGGVAYATVISAYGSTAPIQFGHNSPSLTLDSSGNLGLGVTPSAWANPAVYRAFEIGAKGNSIYTASGESHYTTNCFFNTSGQNIYGANGYATEYQQASGSHRWFTAPSGTAGNAISFTQAMTLTSGGNLLVGTTTNFGSKAVISAANGTAYSSTPQLRISGGNTNNNRAAIIFSDDALQDGKISYYPAASAANSYFSFSARGTESDMILDGSGNLLLNTTSNTYSSRAVFYNASNTVLHTETGSTGTSNQIIFLNPNGIVGSITTNGSATSYNTSSDYRLKDNQAPLTGSGAFIDALQPKTWTWKADGSRGVGFIAHEVQEVSPNSVVGEKDGEQMQAMEYGSAEFIANIIAELQSLRARVASLESK